MPRKERAGRGDIGISTGFAHDFSRISVRHAEDPSLTDVDDEVRRAQSGGGGSGAGGGAPAATPAATASLSITGDGAYVDTATESRKHVSFNVTWSGGAKEDYVIVNWLKGYLKKADGKPLKVKMYGKTVDYDFSTLQVDSLDEDPVYGSSGGVRWRYTVDDKSKFSTTDSPGPMYDSDGKGAKAEVDFQTGVYKSADVPTTTSGTMSATPLSSLQSWSYHVDVLGGGKYKH